MSWAKVPRRSIRGVSFFTDANLGERHAMRNMIDEMRGAGQVMQGPSGFTARNRQEIVNQLDRWLSRVKKAILLKCPVPDSTDPGAPR